MANYKDQQQLIKKLEAEMKWFAERGMATNSTTLTARAHALQTRIERIKSNAIVKPVKRKKVNIEFNENSKTSKDSKAKSLTSFKILFKNPTWV